MRLSRSVGRGVRAAVVGVAVVAVIGACGGQHGSGTAVAFTARTPGGMVPSAGTMEQTKQAVEQRAGTLGVGKTTVTVDADMLTITVAGDDGTAARRLGRSGRLLLRPVLAGKPFQAGPGKTLPGKDVRQSLDPAVQTATLAGIDCKQPDPLRGADDATLPLVTCAAAGDTAYLLGPAVVDGKELTDAKGSMDTRTARYGVNLTLTDIGVRQYTQYTATNVGKQLAFEVDSQVLSAPVIQSDVLTSQSGFGPVIPSAVLGNQSQLVGNFTKDAADDIATTLRLGALPAILTPRG
ncbi:hypothetical protein GPX89_42415 [Nocardia sp. ET3-3]|uniref:SecDF P1 head subdomain domain-containing protein n=1 Tax=Nocardia terrae TaxID=2675851 RepID=A0A7K1VBI4_9NOCA|nr:hypothetical protein [Nocardia terrae]MVU83871.1 hypothetical protein [Nocardia terrae]